MQAAGELLSRLSAYRAMIAVATRALAHLPRFIGMIAGSTRRLATAPSD
jgi:hypothetical protein